MSHRPSPLATSKKENVAPSQHSLPRPAPAQAKARFLSLASFNTTSTNSPKPAPRRLSPRISLTKPVEIVVETPTSDPAQDDSRARSARQQTTAAACKVRAIPTPSPSVSPPRKPSALPKSVRRHSWPATQVCRQRGPQLTSALTPRASHPAHNRDSTLIAPSPPGSIDVVAPLAAPSLGPLGRTALRVQHTHAPAAFELDTRAPEHAPPEPQVARPDAVTHARRGPEPGQRRRGPAPAQGPRGGRRERAVRQHEQDWQAQERGRQRTQRERRRHVQLYRRGETARAARRRGRPRGAQLGPAALLGQGRRAGPVWARA